MDLTRLPDWPPLGLLSAVPESLVAAFVSAVATLALVGLLSPRRRVPGARPAAPQALDPAACDFLIDGSSVKPLTEPARALIDSLAPTGPRPAALAGHLALDRPGIQAEIEALVLYGSGFRHHVVRADGSAQEIVGAPRGGAAWLSIRPASEEARALHDTEDALERATAELGFLRAVLDRAPVMAWSQAPDGQVAWANRAYRDRFATASGEIPDHRIADGFAHLLEEVPLTARGAGVRRRVAVPGRGDDEPHWFEICETPGPSGETLGFALEADDLVAAEASLRRFVETLTETFAHLPIGLAVFDKNRRLGLFNPALTDLVKIDAVWLAGRPSLRDFLERLRETRQMPEQKDFAAWRRKLSELEEGARDGTYEEHWQLPSGKIFRVTGRPHPQGALAFLFEDVSTAIQLERRYRSELELSQATLDRLSEAVAVFDASGMLVFVNSAFETLWSLDPMQRLAGPTVAELTALWAERCSPNPVWARLAEFATAAEARTSWTATVETRAGGRLAVLVAPLPDASALVVFREEAPATAPGALEAFAFDQLALPAEAAMQQLAAVIPTAASPDAFQALSNAARGLKDGLARARELRALAGRPADGPLPELAAALTVRELALDAPAEAAAWPADLRRAALALGLAAADLARPGAIVAVAFDPGRRTLTARADAAPPPRTEPVSLALARRLAEASGGELRQQTTDAAVTLIAELPSPEAGVALRA